MKTISSVLIVTFPLLLFVESFHPECKLQLEIKEEQRKCLARLSRPPHPEFRGCLGVWDNITCWEQAKFGETVTQTCPRVLRHFFSKDGSISRTCTVQGWTDTYPDIFDACGHNENVNQVNKVEKQPLAAIRSRLFIGLIILVFPVAYIVPSICATDIYCQPSSLSFYVIVKAIYTLGHSASLIALTIGSAILCLFRKLHCTRNYIHLNLFLSFILKAISVLMKDDFLFSGYYDCPDSLVGCKIMLAFVHYCVTANFYWLLVEGLYLHTLLVVIFSPNRHFIIYLLIGWGIPTICIIVWIVTRIYLEDTGCWDTNEQSIPWWVIRIPIIVSIIVNFCLFVNIIRILLQKLRSPDVGGNDQSQFKRLTKSTLLLIPLFGVHYMVFAVFPIASFSECQIWFELCIGSFQGLVVAILYCFLNTEVQGELKRKWGSLYLNRYLNRDYRLHSLSISRNGSECASQFKRNSRAPSIMQTETTII